MEGASELKHDARTEQTSQPAADTPVTHSAQPKEPSKLKQIWDKVGLDKLTLILMLKGSLPPTIAIAAYQSTSFAEHFTTLGYLVAIASILGFAIMPRGKFIQVGRIGRLLVSSWSFESTDLTTSLDNVTQCHCHLPVSDCRDNTRTDV
jgi:hypothetical protein